MNFKIVGAAVLAAVMVVPVAAQDEAKGKKKKGQRGEQNAAVQMLKQLEELALTDEQIAKVKELGKASAAKMKELRDEAGITMELVKKRAEASKELRDAGKKGKELMAAIDEATGFSEAQAAAMKKVSEVRMKFQKDVVGLLTDEQKEKLPERMQRSGKRPGKAGGKTKKDAA